MHPNAAPTNIASRITPFAGAGDLMLLENGDRMNRGEFERRYALMPPGRKAELIEGVVHMPSPVSLVHHARPHAQLIAWLGAFCARTPDVDLGDNATVRLDGENEPQPDAVLFWSPARGGRARIAADGYLEGPPDLVVEVAASSVSIDMHDKLRAYRRNGVPEYLVWRVTEQKLDWFELVSGEYRIIAPDADGLLRSRRFPGLVLDAPALIRGDLAAVLRPAQ
ncbi:MAG TPA: Uma2 family endonuclease [Pirellulaceae bacterium]|nr:Uma2 family endonuclease [Pirellulaceae bacterium]